MFQSSGACQRGSDYTQSLKLLIDEKALANSEDRFLQGVAREVPSLR